MPLAWAHTDVWSACGGSVAGPHGSDECADEARTPSLAHELNVDAFLEQARSYDQATSSPMGWMLRNAQVGCPANHPPRTPCMCRQLLHRSRVHTAHTVRLRCSAKHPLNSAFLTGGIASTPSAALRITHKHSPWSVRVVQVGQLSHPLRCCAPVRSTSGALENSTRRCVAR